MTERLSDFWWLPNLIDWRDIVVDLGHNAPLGDNETWSPDNWERHRGMTLEELEEWRAAYGNMNVHRCLVVTTPTGEELLGPVLLDIDSERCTDVDGEQVWTVDLRLARQLACDVVERLRISGLGEEDARVYFSGRKGFHVEVRPAAVGVTGTLDQQVNRAGEWEAWFRNSLELPDRCSIDPIFKKPLPSGGYHLRTFHSFIRLHDSLNCWVDGAGLRHCRRTCALDWEALRSVSIEDLCCRDERAATKADEK